MPVATWSSFSFTCVKPAHLAIFEPAARSGRGTVDMPHGLQAAGDTARKVHLGLDMEYDLW